jgi:hypothetical protein
MATHGLAAWAVDHESTVEKTVAVDPLYCPDQGLLAHRNRFAGDPVAR